MIFFWDFPVAPEGHPHTRIVRSYIWGGYVLPAAESTQPAQTSNTGH